MIRHATRDNDPSVSCNSPFYVKLFVVNQSYNSGSLTNYNSLIWPVIKEDVFLEILSSPLSMSETRIPDTFVYFIALFVTKSKKNFQVT